METEIGTDRAFEITLLHRENGGAQRLRQLRLRQHAEVTALRRRTAVHREFLRQCLEGVAGANTYKKIFRLRARGILVIADLATDSVAIDAGPSGFEISKVFGLIAIGLAAVNIFGGFTVTQRMLAMYKKKERE